MKIVKLKNGYRIRVNDVEFKALAHLVWLGQTDVEALAPKDLKALDADLRRGLKRLAGGLVVTEDRSVEE